MKLYLVFLSAMLFTPLAHSMEWRKNLADDLRKPSLGTIRTWHVRDDGTTIVVSVINKTDEEIKYRGYTRDLAQFYFEEFKDGRWIDSSWMSSGTDMETYTLAPGQKVELIIHRWKAPDHFRAYALFESLDGKRCSLVLLHRDKTKPNQSPEPMPIAVTPPAAQ